MSKFYKSSSLVALSAVLVDVGGVAPAEIKLLPAGSFRSARDNRPLECDFWVMNAEAAASIVAAQAALSSQFLIDYDHASLSAATTPGVASAPAAGWAGGLEWREGDGLYAVDVVWCEAALAAIAAREYRYISPVFRYDQKTGLVGRMLMAALTNYPALDCLTDLAAAAAEVFFIDDGDVGMDELLERLRWLLNLPLTATAEEISAELDKLKTMISADGSTAGLSAILAARDAEIAALSAKVVEGETAVAALSAQVGAAVDPALFVPVAVLKEYQDKLAALSGNTLDLQVDALIADGRKAGKIIGDADAAWCRAMGLRDLAALSGHLDSRQGIAALSGLQSGGVKPVDKSDSAAITGSSEEQQVAKLMGLTLDDVIKYRSK